MTVGPLVIGEGQSGGDVAVVVVVTAKDVEFLVINRFYGMEDIVSGLTAVGDGLLPYL